MLKLTTGALLETVANSSHRATPPALTAVLLRSHACSRLRARARQLSSDSRSNVDQPTTANDERATSQCESSSESRKNADTAPREPPVPPGKEECCGTGCSNCVWLVYAEDLVDYYKDGGAKAAEEVAKIPDPNVRQFVKTELDYILKSEK
uniref:Protein containing Oxidored-like domain n=1 Tax=Rhipicephalus zambeziensis TaxID=60191 RepID=A0A224YF01_9ACAR